MKKSDMESEASRLKKELSRLKKENKSLVTRLETARQKTANLQKELKKKDVRRVVSSEEQVESLSSQLPGIDIPSMLFD
ncbi:MAG: hypothetical protein LBK12_00845 [Odoribacteraceae bacterium]|jgi:regulator of replication initiation timing|nr:hypothetical protein [Odoribacteraceae bacterium]